MPITNREIQSFLPVEMKALDDRAKGAKATHKARSIGWAIFGGLGIAGAVSIYYFQGKIPLSTANVMYVVYGSAALAGTSILVLLYEFLKKNRAQKKIAADKETLLKTDANIVAIIRTLATMEGEEIVTFVDKIVDLPLEERKKMITLICNHFIPG